MRQRFPLAVAAAAAVIVAGCSSSKHPTNLASATTTTTAVAATSTTATPAGLQAASNPTLGTIVVDSSGMTLYRNIKETAGKFVCTGSCTTAWPPLLVPAGGSAPGAGTGLTGTVATINRPDGTTQVTYDGAPLYHFAADKQAGDAKGQGIGAMWFVLSTGPTQSASSSATGAATTTPPTTAAHTATPTPTPTPTPAPTPTTAPHPPTTAPHPPTTAPHPPTTAPHPPTTVCYYPPCY